MNEELKSLVLELLHHNNTVGVYDEFFDVQEQYEEGEYGCNPTRSAELQSILSKLTEAVNP